MGWQDNLDNIIFTIQTGDGRTFMPLWKNGEKLREYHHAIFDFINQPGSLVDRKQPKAMSYPLVFWFQGEDNTDQAIDFDSSAADSRPWTVTHPFYGTITGQPTSIKYNDNFYNATEVTVDFWESIIISLPKQQISVMDTITVTADNLSVVSPVDYSTKVNLKPADISKITDNANKVNASITKALDANSYGPYQQAKNDMFTGIDNMIDDAAGIEAIHSVLLQPATFNSLVQARVSLITTLFNDMVNYIAVNPTANDKYYFESTGAILLSAYTLSLINPLPADYISRADVQLAASGLSATYQAYLNLLDTLYTQSANPVNGFSASPNTQNILQSLVVSTIAGLATIAFNAKQERSVLLTKDSNLIVLTAMYMGLDADDVNIDTFRALNNIKNKSIFLVSKGTEIKYYV